MYFSYMRLNEAGSQSVN